MNLNGYETTPQGRQKFLNLISHNEIEIISKTLRVQAPFDNELLHIALRYAIRADYKEMVDLLLRYAKYLNFDYGRSIPIIHLPVYYDNVEMLNILLQKGSGINVNEPDINGYIPLTLAAKYGQVDIVEALMKAEAEWEEDDILAAIRLAEENKHYIIADMIKEWRGKIGRISNPYILSL